MCFLLSSGLLLKLAHNASTAVATSLVGDVQVASVVRSGDVLVQPHHIFVVNDLLDDAVHAAVNIVKPGLCQLISYHDLHRLTDGC